MYDTEMGYIQVCTYICSPRKLLSELNWEKFFCFFFVLSIFEQRSEVTWINNNNKQDSKRH